MMKKFLLLMLTLICAIAFVACGTTTESTSESQKETTSQKESVLESQSEKESEKESEEESEESQSEEESAESVVATFTITFEVNLSGVTAPEAIVVESGEEVTLPTVDCEYQLRHWVIKGTDTVFADGEFTLDQDVTLVAVFYTETQVY